MSPIETVLLAGVLLVLALVAVLVFRRSPGEREAGLLQQQLVELRARLDALGTAQRDVPRALAEGSAAQVQVLADVRERLGELGAVARRLETVGETVTEVQQLLQVPKLRGTLGEVWLEELLRQILPPAHFRMQHRFASGERVDAVVTLGDRLVQRGRLVHLGHPGRALERRRDQHPEDRAGQRVRGGGDGDGGDAVAGSRWLKHHCHPRGCCQTRRAYIRAWLRRVVGQHSPGPKSGERT
ncbi:MAG: DNA recombination protein RmuC [Tepidiformaceae bacterium]